MSSWHRLKSQWLFFTGLLFTIRMCLSNFFSWRNADPFTNQKGYWWTRTQGAMASARVAFPEDMMRSSNRNIFRVTGHLCREFTGHRRTLRTKASDAQLWCFLWSAWINGWINNRQAGDLRRHRTHYDVNVMMGCLWSIPLLRKMDVLSDQNPHSHVIIHIWDSSVAEIGICGNFRQIC